MSKYLYHITPSKNRASIEKDGLKPFNRVADEEEQIYLFGESDGSTDLQEAERMAEIVVLKQIGIASGTDFDLFRVPLENAGSLVADPAAGAFRDKSWIVYEPIPKAEQMVSMSIQARDLTPVERGELIAPDEHEDWKEAKVRKLLDGFDGGL